MSEYLIKLAAALPKGEGTNGFDDEELAEEMFAAKIQGRSVQPRVALIIFDAKKAEVTEGGDHVVHTRIRRVQVVDTIEGRQIAEKLLTDEYTADHGDMLPFDITSLSKSTFGDLPKTTDEVDEAEERERDNMSPADELRRHLERVHGRADANLLTDGEAEHRHEADHSGDLPVELAHDPSWIGWTRADLEAATAESDDANSDEQAGGPEPDADGDTDGSRAGSPHESSDPDQVDQDDDPGNVRHVEFSGRG